MVVLSSSHNVGQQQADHACSKGKVSACMCRCSSKGMQGCMTRRPCMVAALHHHAYSYLSCFAPIGTQLHLLIILCLSLCTVYCVQGPMTANNNHFDGHYFNEIVYGAGRGGWFDSDRTLATSAPVAGLPDAVSHMSAPPDSACTHTANV